ncbi:MAG: hypothetical protein IJ128_07290 [Firmicutes bacterium]|nr:hypothetical protein [Bacillota bacterium]
MKKTIFAAALSLVLALTICSTDTFAAGASDTPDGSSYAIQNAAGTNGNIAIVTLGKILTCNRSGDFPGVTDFEYSIEAVEGWTNANVSTALSGEPVAAADMPKPAAAPGDRAITSTGLISKVLVGNFQDLSAQNHSTGDGDDNDYRRTRTTPVHIAFTEAGYYVYKVKETGSVPADLPGVDYDDNEYFMVFYVCNKVDWDGNTTEGVYVHSITSYANASGSENFKPELSDIQNLTDNGGSAAAANTGQVGPDGTVTHQLGKVGVSDPESPNRLEAYRMWNAFVSHDLVLKKNVSGNLGDRSKLFEFTITLTGLEKNRVYTTQTAAEDTGDVTTAEIVSASVGTRNSDSSFTSDAGGAATILVKMKDDDCIVINGLPLSSQYRISEAASDHVAKYEIVSSGTGAGQNAPVIAVNNGSNGRVTDRALATGTETVDRYDETVTVQFTNNRDLATITGVPGLDPAAWIVAVLLFLTAAMLMRRRRVYAGADTEAMDALAKDRPLD